MKIGKVIFLLAVGWASTSIVFAQGAQAKSLLNGDGATAPLFKLNSMDGKAFDLAALRGKIVVLNFWFTGCVPCVAEFPKLNSLVDKFKDKDVVFIAPTLDGKTVLQTFLKKHLFKYDVVPNASSLIVSTYSDGSGNIAFPTQIVIDREGKISKRISGAENYKVLQKAIEQIVSR